MPDFYLTAKSAAAQVGVSPRTITRAMQSLRLHSAGRDGRARLIHPAELARWDGLRRRTAPDLITISTAELEQLVDKMVIRSLARRRISSGQDMSA